MNSKLSFFILFLLTFTHIIANPEALIVEQKNQITLDDGWTVSEIKSGPNESEFNSIKTSLISPQGITYKEIEHSFSEDKIINFKIVNNRILISIYNVNVENPNKREWTFEILDFNKNQIFIETFIYHSNFELFPRDLVIRVNKFDYLPYIVSVDDCYIYYLDKSLSKFIREKIIFENENSIYKFTAYPIGINYYNNSILVEYKFTSLMSDDTTDNQIIKIPIK